MKIVRGKPNIWFSGGQSFTNTQIFVNGYNILRRSWDTFTLRTEYWVDFHDDAKGLVPPNAQLMNPYSKEFGWLSFNTLREAYYYLSGAKPVYLMTEKEYCQLQIELGTDGLKSTMGDPCSKFYYESMINWYTDRLKELEKGE